MAQMTRRLPPPLAPHRGCRYLQPRKESHVEPLRSRLTSHLPVAGLSEERVRWRKPGSAWFTSLRLDEIVAAHWSKDRVVLVVNSGAAQEIPLKEMHFSKGSFAVSLLRFELERHLQANGRAQAQRATRAP